jgi:hypothetical protein
LKNAISLYSYPDADTDTPIHVGSVLIFCSYSTHKHEARYTTFHRTITNPAWNISGLEGKNFTASFLTPEPD